MPKDRPLRDEPVRQWRTGLQHTTVHHAEDGWFTWSLRAGSAAPPRPAPRLSSLDSWRALPGLAVARQDGSALSYRAPGSTSLAQAFLDGTGDGVLDAVERAGALLRTAHDAPVPAAARAWPSPAVIRLLHGTSPQFAPTRLHARMQAVLGRRRCERLRSWAAEPPSDGSDEVLLHGSATPRAVVVSGDSRCTLRIGADCVTGDRSWDLEWFLASLFELCAGTEPSIGLHTGTSYRQAHEALITGYGRELPATAGPVAVLGVLGHVHDFAAYVGWSDELDDYLRASAQLIDEAGAQIVSPA
ncbi:hypothetical protein GCM10027271_26890 [Saccharopolyspora gloriosae]|uniref:Phosphotransferase family enzyme n=1 Tax=Saccharopolyspora gloriosae TaxID=455344 RepID=A0A840NQT7_9PSEU|nr:hypothetical protein [Saccharopolyspora gloriosae]MBB5071472.1 hypothetical protein [Saccharopolyspora gloriosae]